MIASLDVMFGPGTQGGANRYAYDQHMLMIYIFLIVVAAVLAAVGSLGLITTTSLNVRERRRELAVLRAIGASPSTVAAIVVIEAVFIAAVSAVAAVAVAWPITAAMMRLIGGIFVAASMSSSHPQPSPAGWCWWSPCPPPPALVQLSASLVVQSGRPSVMSKLLLVVIVIVAVAAWFHGMSVIDKLIAMHGG